MDAVKPGQRRLSKSQFGPRFAAGLGVADETEDDAEAGRRQEAAVLLVGDLPYLAATTGQSDTT